MSRVMVNTDITKIAWLPGGFKDVEKPTMAELSKAVDITCAIVAGYTLGMEESDMVDGERYLCSKGKAKRRGAGNYNGEFTFGREADVSEIEQNSAFLRAAKAFAQPGVVGDIIRRGGVATDPASALPASEAFKAGQTIEIYRFETDYPQYKTDQNDEDATFTNKLIPTGVFNHSVKLPTTA
ncbi:phage tail tube protein [Actinotignum urinale]|uniref:phage tail tube protein n=1 Tax=Actinotignum urinale TaxID=190146 RepID=UPI0003B75DB2|nr:hypothetical protein [Actinotignum urinale]MDY5159569.1 hypothetical protein [Actinotignum urinale]